MDVVHTGGKIGDKDVQDMRVPRTQHERERDKMPICTKLQGKTAETENEEQARIEKIYNGESDTIPEKDGRAREGPGRGNDEVQVVRQTICQQGNTEET